MAGCVKRPTELNVYYHPNADGLHSFLVAARNQREACALIRCTVGDFRRMGGRRIGRETMTGKVAMGEPGRVFKQRLDPGGPPQPRVYADAKGA